MLDSRAQGREIGRCRKIVGIDEKRRIQIGGCDFTAAERRMLTIVFEREIHRQIDQRAG